MTVTVMTVMTNAIGHRSRSIVTWSLATIQMAAIMESGDREEMGFARAQPILRPAPAAPGVPARGWATKFQNRRARTPPRPGLFVCQLTRPGGRERCARLCSLPSVRWVSLMRKVKTTPCMLRLSHQISQRHIRSGPRCACREPRHCRSSRRRRYSRARRD